MSCPRCDKVLDGATSVPGNDKPEARPGDLSVCVYCGTILRFDTVEPSFTYHILTEEERKVIDRDTLTRLDHVQRVITLGEDIDDR